MIRALTFKFRPGKDFFILDQTLLPEKKRFVKIESPAQMARAIKELKVRGANIIGITAGFSLAQYALLKRPSAKQFALQAGLLKKARPTAVHLSKAVDLIIRQKSPEQKLRQALAFYEEDTRACRQIARLAQPLIKKGDGLLTYCNAGALATSGEGTALGVIKQAFKEGKRIHAYACETRPVNQGARLSFWELRQTKIPSTLICDNMIASLIVEGKIQKAFVGADRISANGDTANKIGTLNLAVICRHFKIPFYVAAPVSTIDKNLKAGRQIPIEQRDPKEVSPYWAKMKATIKNPAFDITPKELISGIITENEIWRP